MAFLEDPRLRQRWNQLSQNAEAVTENAAAGIWTFQHTYVTPCLGTLCQTLDSCTSVCLGDREERARRQRERARGAHRTRAEYSFDFYDDWYDDYYGGADGTDGAGDGGGGGGGGGSGSGLGSGLGGLFTHSFFGGWGGGSGGIRAEDWDRLLAGSGSTRRRHDGDGGVGGVGGDGAGAGDGVHGSSAIDQQPRPRRSMSYGTRGDGHGDPTTIIPSTAPLGFLGRLPFKIGGTLRYKPSAANLREHPAGGSGGSGEHGHSLTRRDEREPLLADADDGNDGGAVGEAVWQSTLAAAATGAGAAGAALTGMGDGGPGGGPADRTRQRSNTTGSGDTSDSFRSRGDLFASDEEGDEDAVPLDDEFAVALDRVTDDRSSGRTRFSSSSSLRALALGGGGSTPPRRKGKRRADTVTSARSALSRNVSYTTMGDSPMAEEAEEAEEAEAEGTGTTEAAGEPKPRLDVPSGSDPHEKHEKHDDAAALERIRQEDERVAHEEEAAVEQRRQRAAVLARARGLAETGDAETGEAETERTMTTTTEATANEAPADEAPAAAETTVPCTSEPRPPTPPLASTSFVPARLPHFG